MTEQHDFAAVEPGQKLHAEDIDDPLCMPIPSSVPNGFPSGGEEEEEDGRHSHGQYITEGSRRDSVRLEHAFEAYASESRLHLTWKERIKHFTWTWFTMTMATGGIANVLHSSRLKHSESIQLHANF